MCSKTPAMIAAAQGHALSLEELLKHPKFDRISNALTIPGKNDNVSSRSIDLRDKDGRTALLWACYAGELGTAKVLLAHGANADLGDYSMRTPLMWAATSSRGLPLVELLLSYSVDVLLKDTSGATALTWAEERGDMAIISAIAHKSRQAKAFKQHVSS